MGYWVLDLVKHCDLDGDRRGKNCDLVKIDCQDNYSSSFPASDVNYGEKKPVDYGEKKPADYGEKKPADYGEKKPADYGEQGDMDRIASGVVRIEN